MCLKRAAQRTIFERAFDITFLVKTDVILQIKMMTINDLLEHSRNASESNFISPARTPAVRPLEHLEVANSTKTLLGTK